MKVKPRKIEDDIEDIVDIFGHVATYWGADYKSNTFFDEQNEVRKQVRLSLSLLIENSNPVAVENLKRLGITFKKAK